LIALQRLKRRGPKRKKRKDKHFSSLSASTNRGLLFLLGLGDGVCLRRLALQMMMMVMMWFS
jgi:hypothetical protein